ncbi:transcriptional regulator MntR [Chromatiales bacterium (ex Bugula neritina AB1)]|nr:transcriptional regulator MntR [Chromatiales bacterium (ex Bugula neritina AB1)]
MTNLEPQTGDALTTDDRPPKAQATGFAIVRQAHESEMAEDYVELISELIETRGEARLVDLAERLGVKPPTVTKNINRLKGEGLVHGEKYRAIFLTERGKALADSCRRRHRTVVAFLISLGIDAENAERDAEGIEHHVSETTLSAFEAHLNEFNRKLNNETDE